MKLFAFIFPGQGSQSVGMLDSWGAHPVVRRCVDEASAALGEDLGRLIREGPKETLALTTNTQPVMLLAGVATFQVWMHEVGIRPAVVAGHSLGEYSALVAAGALSLSDAVPLVRLRAQAMQDAVPVGEGAMAAVLGLSSHEVVAVCARCVQEFSEVVEAVNFNDPAQTVIAGSRAGVEKASEQLKAQGAKRVLPLPVSAPFHSSLMQPAALRLREALQKVALAPPQIDVVNNVDVAVERDPQRIRDALFRQAFSPVRWVECVQAMQARGVGALVECGPGKVLTGLTRRVDPALSAWALFDPVTLQEVKEALQ